MSTKIIHIWYLWFLMILPTIIVDLIKLDVIFQEENISQESHEDVMLDFGCFIICVLDKAHMVNVDYHLIL